MLVLLVRVNFSAPAVVYKVRGEGGNVVVPVVCAFCLFVLQLRSVSLFFHKMWYENSSSMDLDALTLPRQCLLSTDVAAP